MTERKPATAAAPCSLCRTRCGGACDSEPAVFLVLLIAAAITLAVILLV